MSPVGTTGMLYATSVSIHSLENMELMKQAGQSSS